MPRRDGSGAKQRIDRDLVRQLLDGGTGPRDVAEILGTTERTVLRIRHELGLPVAPGPIRTRLTSEDLALIEECLQEGMPFSEITRTHGYTHQTLSRRFPGRGMSLKEASAIGLAVRHANYALRKQRIPALC